MANDDGELLGGRRETDKERLDRNLFELMAELRVALPGVQVLFAFLLVVPFNERFGDVTGFQARVYFATLLLTALASALLIAPAVHHRLQFRRQRKEHLVMVGNRVMIAGLCTLGLAMTGVVLLITDFVFGFPASLVVTVLAAAVFVSAWFVLPQGGRPDAAAQSSGRGQATEGGDASAQADPTPGPGPGAV